MPIDVIKLELPRIPKTSGVYQFFDKKDQILYVGKAKNLKKRVTNYTNKNRLCPRILRMTSLAHKIEIIQTETEVEALLLEHNLIKKLSPRYNILLKDGKTFPFIRIHNHNFPGISSYRGTKQDKGHYFGPFASAHNVNSVIDILRKAFLIRNCKDSDFKNRKKPCLEYQIKKCSAPCVNLIKKDEYQTSINDVLKFLQGKNDSLQDELKAKMANFSQNQNYEKAAVVRDQVKALDMIQSKQNINVFQLNNADVITFNKISNIACFYISFYRNGQNYGAKPYFFEIDDKQDLVEFLTSFIGQFYLSSIPPKNILINHKLEDERLMEDYLGRIINSKVEITIPKRGEKYSLIKSQEKICLQNIEQKISQNMSNKELLIDLKKFFNLKRMPKKIEVYDNSHTSGTNAVGAMICAGVDGFIKNDYRKFNVEKGDDTKMMKEVLTRRFSKLQKKDFPDFIIIDGGKPQLSAVKEVFNKLKINIPLTCMSKGENRNAGEENFHQINQKIKTLPKNNSLMYYLQRLRDEAHRFAIMTHRKKRAKNML